MKTADGSDAAMTDSLAEQAIERLMTLHPKGFDLSLGRITRLLDRLGNPQDRLPPVIHVAGTNGKGSCCAFTRAVLEAAGLTVHVHTKPHLVRWHERYRLGRPGGGRFVEDTVLADAVERVAAANGGEAITVFEILTAVGFLLFFEHPADAAVIEVGLGGRFDATNVIKRPAVSVIMPISLDHEAYLGDRVELIAAEKAGIIKPGVPVVVGQQESDAVLEVFSDTAERLGAPARFYAQDYFGFGENGRMVFQDETGLVDLPAPRLPGRHQFANAAAAIMAVRAAGFNPSDRALADAMGRVEWPGRLQRLQAGRLAAFAPENSEIWLDGGHNPGAGTVVSEFLAGREESAPRPLFLVVGMISAKDQTSYFRAFAGLARHVFTVPVGDSESGVPAAELAARASEAGLSAEPVASVENALKLLRDTWDDAEPAPRVLIGGSLYLAGAVLAENGTPPA